MSDNPLAGVPIPSLSDIVESAVERLGDGVVDLSNKLQKDRLREWLVHTLDCAITSELERAINISMNKAVTHVFRVMRDEHYQAKRKRRLEESRKQRALKREKREAQERKERMLNSRARLKVETPTIQ